MTVILKSEMRQVKKKNSTNSCHIDVSGSYRENVKKKSYSTVDL